jgi:hypothetical protein
VLYTFLIPPLLTWLHLPYRLLTFQVPNLMSFFHCLDRAKKSVQIRGALKYFVRIKNFYGEGLSAPHPTPKLEDHHLSAVRDCWFNIFAATLRTRRTSLQPQPEDEKYFKSHTLVVSVHPQVFSTVREYKASKLRDRFRQNSVGQTLTKYFRPYFISF